MRGDKDWKKQANAELAKQGLRLGDEEPGWYVTLMINGEPVKVWATDEPPNDGDNDADDACPECGAPPFEPCDPRCPNAERDEPDPDRYREGVSFDKFMDRILTEETSKPGLRTEADSPHRKRQAARQERPMGRTVIGGKQ